MAQHCCERLSAGIEAQPLRFKRVHTAGAQLCFGGELAQQRFRHRKRETGIAPCERMTDPIAFLCVEEEHLIGFGDGISAAQMTHVYAAIRKNQMRELGPLLGASMIAAGRAANVPKNHGLRAQKGLDQELLHSRFLCSTDQVQVQLIDNRVIACQCDSTSAAGLSSAISPTLVRLPARPGDHARQARAERLTTRRAAELTVACIYMYSLAMKLQSLPCYCATLRQAARAVTVLYEEVVGDSGLHATQYTALQIIELAPNLTTTELAQAIGIDQTTATRTLALIKKGGLATDTVGSDRRQRHWVLTPKGQAQLRRLRPKWEAAQEAFEKRLGRAEAAALKKAAYLAASKLSSQ